MTQLGAQMFTVREYTKNTKDLLETFAKLKAIGYDAVQVSAIGADIPVEAVADGTLPVGVTLEETALKRIAAGDDIQLLYPAEGTSAVPDGSALIKGAPHGENARRFLDFVIGIDVQKRVAAFYRRSVRTDVPPSDRLTAQAELRLIDYNLTWASAAHDDILACWAALAGTGGGA